MNIDYEPWSATHAPQKFARRDPTGRWSPIHEDIPNPGWMAALGGAAFGAVLALMLVLAI